MENKISNKAIDLTGLAIGIIVLGIVVSMGAVILTGVRDSRLTDLDTYTTANTTFTSPSKALSNIWVKEIVNVTNTTNNVKIPSTNYSLTVNEGSGVGTFTNTSTNPWSWNITYNSYNTSRADWALPDQAAIGLGEYGNWFDIIVIVGVAGVVLALIFMAFGKSSETSGGEGGVAY